MRWFFVYFISLPLLAAIPDSLTIVIFGVTGDLAARKILPAIEHLEKEGYLPQRFALVGVGRRSEKEFREQLRHRSSIHYHQAEFQEEEGYESLAQMLAQLDEGKPSNRIYFLATQPSQFSQIIEKLYQHHFIYPPSSKQWSRVLIEKPFGRDLDSALALQTDISQFLDESQIYRIDHYLSKEGVQNLISWRQSNGLDSIWNKDHIASITVTISEQIGIGTRANLWEESGYLRDITQNHLMQLLSLVAMETQGDCREEKIQLLQAILPIDLESVVRGQYGRGEIDGSSVLGYREERGVPPDSKAETYLSTELFINNERWRGVPFKIRGGKRLSDQLAEIQVQFKDQAVLHIRIQPRPAIFFEGYAPYNFPPFPFTEGYQKLLFDCIEGNQSFFVHREEVFSAWRLLTPILDYWKSNPDLLIYPAGQELF